MQSLNNETQADFEAVDRVMATVTIMAIHFVGELYAYSLNGM